jgi:hypothetical protein
MAMHGLSEYREAQHQTFERNRNLLNPVPRLWRSGVLSQLSQPFRAGLTF